MRRTVIKIITIGVIAVMLLSLFGCAANKYNVDYCGAKDLYRGAKDSYKAGTKVTLYFELIATDTDYSFTLDGEPLKFEYDDKKGFVISFTMPEHDVKLECHWQNSIVYVP